MTTSNRRGFEKTVVRVAAIAFIALLILLFFFNFQKYLYKERGVPNRIESSRKLNELFSKTKEVCFGRYILTVPVEARLVFGYQEFPGKIVTHKNAAGQAKHLADAYIVKLRQEDDDTEVVYIGPGAIPSSLQIRFFSGAFLKQEGAQGIRNFDQLDDHVFEYGWGSGNEESAKQIMKRMTEISRNLRVRDNSEVPKEPGVCIDEGFISDNTSNDQEIFSAGIFLPSIPDARFSIMSNKNASTDGPNGVGLIKRHEGAMTAQGVVFPVFAGMARLRMGRHTVNTWDGEEVLLRHNGEEGAIAHEFLWEFVGKTGDRARPASVDIQLDTGVADDTKFATRGSLSDDEAVALWDKFLNSLRFRN
ncbi:MAG: T6SS immunity protein Tli4 family protein [Telluria sp.]